MPRANETTVTPELRRFIEAQENDYHFALEEIKGPGKRTHWIWYVFPQLKGLGSSWMSEEYGIRGMREARAYYSEPYLRRHLLEITSALLTHAGEPIADVMGSSIDAKKLRSCMTLFEAVTRDSAAFADLQVNSGDVDLVCRDAVRGHDLFVRVLDTFFNGSRDRRTLDMIAAESSRQLRTAVDGSQGIATD